MMKKQMNHWEDLPSQRQSSAVSHEVVLGGISWAVLRWGLKEILGGFSGDENFSSVLPDMVCASSKKLSESGSGEPFFRKVLGGVPSIDFFRVGTGGFCQ